MEPRVPINEFENEIVDGKAGSTPPLQIRTLSLTEGVTATQTLPPKLNPLSKTTGMTTATPTPCTPWVELWAKLSPGDPSASPVAPPRSIQTDN